MVPLVLTMKLGVHVSINVWLVQRGLGQVLKLQITCSFNKGSHLESTLFMNDVHCEGYIAIT